MADMFSKSERSRIMRSVGSKGTSAEKQLEQFLRTSKIRFRRNVETLPGCPDFVLSDSRAVVFVHGCFWHGHKGCKRATPPSSNVAYWKEKIQRNRQRDTRVRRHLRRAGWRTAIFWECRLRNSELVSRRLLRLANPVRIREKLR